MSTRKYSLHRRIVILFSLTSLGILFGTPAFAGKPAKKAASQKIDPAKLSGRLEHTGFLKVLHLWGDPRERGIAHGYLLGANIHETIRLYLDDERLSGGPEIYEKMVARYVMIRFMPDNPGIEQELAGMLAGMQARLGDKGMMMPALRRAIDLRDLRAIQFAADAAPRGCSSFAAWGRLTKDGGTLAGRNLDWFASECVVGHSIVIVQAADAERKRLGWVSLTWPGAIGCYTAMNETGLTLAIHDVAKHSVRPTLDISPRPLVLREVIERSAARTAESDVNKVLRAHHVLVGTNLAVALPRRATDTPSLVFEYDGRQSQTGGVTLRRPEADTAWQICTNHYRARDSQTAGDAKDGCCSRYDALMKSLRASDQTLNVKAAWKLLDCVAMSGRDSDGILTLQSVVFEPDALRMHVAFAQPGQPASRRPPTTLDVKAAIDGARP